MQNQVDRLQFLAVVVFCFLLSTIFLVLKIGEQGDTIARQKRQIANYQSILLDMPADLRDGEGRPRWQGSKELSKLLNDADAQISEAQKILREATK